MAQQQRFGSRSYRYNAMTFLIALAVIVLIAVGLLSFTAKKEARKLRESGK